jgi:hypothetical protein
MITIFCTVVLSTDPGNGTKHRSSVFSKRQGVTVSRVFTFNQG